MPDQATVQKAKRDLRIGKIPSTAAGEFVRDEIHHIRAGRHGARSTKQAIAIGLSEARRAGVPLRPKTGAAAVARPTKARSRKRSEATTAALKREPKAAASKTALSRHSRKVAATRSPAVRSSAAKKAALTRRRLAR